MLHENICTSSKVGQITDFEEILYTRMLLLTDSWGCVKNAEGYLKDQCFPSKTTNNHRNNKITYDKIKKGIKSLVDIGLLISFEYDERQFLLFQNFHEFQELKSDRLGISVVTGQKHTAKVNILDIIGWDGTVPEPERKRGHEVKGEGEGEVEVKYICAEEISSFVGEKIQFVRLSKNGLDNLIEKLGDKKTKEKIIDLDLYIGSKGTKYKDHYLTILSWDRKDKKNLGDKNSPVTRESLRQKWGLPDDGS